MRIPYCFIVGFCTFGTGIITLFETEFHLGIGIILIEQDRSLLVYRRVSNILSYS